MALTAIRAEPLSDCSHAYRHDILRPTSRRPRRAASSVTVSETGVSCGSIAGSDGSPDTAISDYSVRKRYILSIVLEIVCFDKRVVNLKLHSEILGGTYTRTWSDTPCDIWGDNTRGYLDELVGFIVSRSKHYLTSQPTEAIGVNIVVVRAGSKTCGKSNDSDCCKEFI